MNISRMLIRLFKNLAEPKPVRHRDRVVRHLGGERLESRALQSTLEPAIATFALPRYHVDANVSHMSSLQDFQVTYKSPGGGVVANDLNQQIPVENE